MADADALKAKGGDYDKETARIVDSTIAENGVTFVNINVHNVDKWTCTACGKTGITSNFCPDCGTKLFDKNNVVLCKHCGRIVSKDDIYCPDCGNTL